MLIIRQEKPSEFQTIYDLVKVAFQTAKVADGDEQDYVNKLRESGNYIAELALVAEENGSLVGHIMLTKTHVAKADGSKFLALLLAPLCVELNHRKRGVGSKLLRESLELAKKFGYDVVFVVGDPAYYGRFGFKPSALFKIKHAPPIPDENVMVLELTSNALSAISGTVTFT